nr:UDP-glucuronosyl/UDP-glucosyltransferase [Tanacetum cinerariifolium]
MALHSSVADSLKLPRVVLITSSMSCILVYAALPVLREKGYFKDTIQEEHIQDLEPMTNKDILKIMKGEFEEGKMELIANMIKETSQLQESFGTPNSKQRFLWVVRPGSVSGSQWLESLPKGFIEEVGVMLDNEMGREEIGRAIKRVIIDKEGTEMRQRSKSLQEMVNLSLEKGGSANRSLESLVDCILSF